MKFLNYFIKKMNFMNLLKKNDFLNYFILNQNSEFSKNGSSILFY